MAAATMATAKTATTVEATPAAVEAATAKGMATGKSAATTTTE
jgi:hypothetical protein